MQQAYLDRLEERDAALERLRRELLPELETGPVQTLGVRIYPYQAEAVPGETIEFDVQITNLAAQPCELQAGLAVPDGWQVEEQERALHLPGRASGTVKFHVTPRAARTIRRARIAVDLRVAGRRLGQRADALVTVL